MEAFALYLLKSVIWLTGFTLVYFLFLRNERFFRLKRYYLIAGILISFIFPFFTFHYQVEIPAPGMNYQGIIPSDTGNISVVGPDLNNKPFDFSHVLLIVYLAGIILMASKAIRSMGMLFRTINKTKVDYRNRAKLVRAPEFSDSFSFFNYIFINPSMDEKEQDVILNHELVHVNQRHWLDLLLVELLRLFQWVNPFVWIYTRFIKQNHEYIADEAVLQYTHDPSGYKAVLVNQLFDSRVISLSNSFNYSLNKKRFDMMKKIVTSPYRKMKILIVLPLFAIVFYAFATPEYNYISDSEAMMKSPGTTEIIQKEARGVVVKEDGKPLPGVNVIVTNSAVNVLTDANGKFAILRVPEGSSLIFSYKGYKTYILPPLITSNSSLYVKLVKDPDYKEKVEVRNTDGSQIKALVVVDGVISGSGIDKLDPNSILSMSVLKDEAAVDKYGEKGKDGVIEITTKEVNVQDKEVDQKTVKGVVLDENGQPLSGVMIMSTGTQGFASTDGTRLGGKFELNNIQPDASLLFSCRGYKELTLKADFSKEMTVRMEKDPEYKAPVFQNINPLVVIDGVITDKNYREVYKDLGYNMGVSKFLNGKEATDKYGDKGANGVMEITTRKKALEMGLKPPFPRLAPEDFPTFQNQRYSSFNYWVADQVKYPSEAQSKKIEGWVQISFSVELDGTLSNIVSAPGPTDPVLTEEVMRVIKNSPKWDPPKNPAVDMPFNLSVTIGFKLPDQIIKESPYVVVEQMPMYPGGEMELLKFIAENTQYPEAAKAQKIQGKVIIRFIVNTEGNTEGITVLKGVDPMLDAEAVRVVSLLSGFKPGMQNGKAVPVWYMVPVNFILPN